MKCCSIMLRALRRCRRGRGPWYLGYRGKYGPAQRQEGYWGTLGGLLVVAMRVSRVPLTLVEKDTSLTQCDAA